MFDVVIVGAGVAGCTAAIALAPTHRVLLMDKQAQAQDRIGESLPPAARRILRRLDLLQAFEAQPHIAGFGMQSYWGSEQVQMVDSIRNPDGHGWHVDRQDFEQLLRDNAQQRGVTCLWPARLTSAGYQRDRWILGTDHEEPVHATFVIDAGGRHSPFARMQGIARSHVDRLVACWATFASESSVRRGVIAASEIGWWYSAPLPNDARVIAFFTDADLLPEGASKDLSAFMELAKGCPAMQRVIAAIPAADSAHGALHRGVCTACSSRLTQVTGPGWAALGDAATSFDPLSSQGMFNAMAGAMQLADLLRARKNMQSEYQHQIDRIWAHYLSHRHLYYRLERRWKDAPFWSRR